MCGEDKPAEGKENMNHEKNYLPIYWIKYFSFSLSPNFLFFYWITSNIQ